jgi:hypothetical protein
MFGEHSLGNILFYGITVCDSHWDNGGGQMIGTGFFTQERKDYTKNVV